LETLEYLSEKHLIRWGKDGIEPLFGTPKEFFENEKDKEDISDLLNMEKIFQDLDESTSEFGLGKMGNLMKSFLQLQPSGIEITEQIRHTKENVSKLKIKLNYVGFDDKYWAFLTKVT
jgi:hypothetical protein